MAEGKVFVTDWYSETGTYVNGEKIYTETLLRPNDNLIVGAYQIRYAMSTESRAEYVSFKQGAGADEPAATRPEFDDPCDRQPPPQPMEPAGGPVPGDSETGIAEFAPGEINIPGEPLNESVPANDVASQLQAAHEEIERLNRELEYQMALAAMHDSRSSPYDGFGGDESDLLRAEIEHLQTELSRRETEIQELLGRQPNENLASDDADDSDTARLVERLDQLLSELKASDERVRNLETLLQASDDAAHAEREEREQLSCWVTEIDSRVSERERNWQLEKQRLEGKLQEATQRYEQAENNIEQVVKLHANEFQQNMQKQVSELTRQNSRLASELESAKSAYSQLEKLVAEVGVSESELKAMAVKQDELRAHEVELAQERAQIARQRAEVARLRDELELAVGQVQPQDMENPDCRIRQFREHLREIHEKEQQERRQRSLSGRISRLWKRVDDN